MAALDYSIVKPNAKFPCIDIDNDFGAFVGVILSSPERFAGKKLLASNGLFSFGDLSEGLTKASGKSVEYVQIPEETFRTYLPPALTFSKCLSFLMSICSVRILKNG